MDNLQSQNSLLYEEIFVRNTYMVERADIENNIVFDIGANIGFFSKFINNFNPNRIIAIEPNERNYKQLIENTKDIKNIIYLNKAVFNDKTDYVDCVGEGTTCHIESGSKISTISIIKLIDLLGNDRNDLFLKMDIEGSEYEAMYGLDKEIIRKFKTICIEIHKYNGENIIFTIDNFKKYIESCGFRCNSFPDKLFGFKYNEKKEIIDFIPIPMDNCKFTRID